MVHTANSGSSAWKGEVSGNSCSWSQTGGVRDTGLSNVSTFSLCGGRGISSGNASHGCTSLGSGVALEIGPSICPGSSSVGLGGGGGPLLPPTAGVLIERVSTGRHENSGSGRSGVDLLPVRHEVGSSYRAHGVINEKRVAPLDVRS